ncbi:hypothetical protein [Methyloversatilis discipulorum]|uniref:hypothetical protein n=1 Tax=Methyloversatilis discipulorum TaxID=1119528 RepID=UPI00037E1F35|nr:hypothetical protein [Methyloversatilis discipulorum]
MECMTEHPVHLHRGPAKPGGAFDVAAFRGLDFARAEDDAIWTREWVCVGSTLDIPAAGDLLPFTVGDHAIHVQRLPDGGFAGRFNKAQHGGCRVVPLQCQQGAKTPCSFTSCGHSLDRPPIAAGELGEGTPEMYQYLGLRPERLLPVRTAIWGPLLYVSLDPHGPSFDPTARALTSALPAWRGEPADRHRARWIACDANWKLVAQHLLGASATCASGDVALCRADAEDQAALLFPNLVLLSSAAGCCAVVLQPVSLTRTLCRVAHFGPDDSSLSWETLLHTRLAAAAQAQSAIEGGGIGGRGCDPAGQLNAGGRWIETQVMARIAAR